MTYVGETQEDAIVQSSSTGLKFVTADPSTYTIKAQASNSVTQSIPDTTETALTFNTEDYDTDTMYAGASPTRLTINTSGDFRIEANATFDTNIVGDYYILIKKNGTTTVAQSATISAEESSNISISTSAALLDTDYIEIYVAQTSGGNLNILAGSYFNAALIPAPVPSGFQVDSTGNITKINNVTYSWPAVQGPFNYVLTNLGSGNLSWEKTAGTGDLLPSYNNLFIRSNPTNPTYQVDITADVVILLDTSNNGVVYRNIATTTTVDLTASGINGLDTGSEASNTTYYIWLIGNDIGGIYGLFSTSATAPTVPPGYNYKRRFGFVRNNSSGNLLGFSQTNDMYQYDQSDGDNQVLHTSGVTTTPTSLDISALAPAGFMRRGLFSVQIGGASGTTDFVLSRGDTTGSTNTDSIEAYFVVNGGYGSTHVICGISPTGTIKYSKTTGSVSDSWIIRMAGGWLQL